MYDSPFLPQQCPTGAQGIIDTQKAREVALVKNQRSECQQLLLCPDPSLGNEELVRGEHMLAPFEETDALWFNPKTKRTTVSRLFCFSATVMLLAGVGV